MRSLYHLVACVLLLTTLLIGSIDAGKEPDTQTSLSFSSDMATTNTSNESATPTDQVAVDVASLKIGEYFRPQGGIVSGVINSTAPYLRAPCPALNSLANHGLLPRDGRNITRPQLQRAVSTAFNIEFGFAGSMLKELPQTFTLADTSLHNHIEHDASFVHLDLSYNKDPSVVDLALWEDLAARATNGKLGVKEFGAAAHDRIKQCKTKPKGCEFDLGNRAIMFGEAALVLRSFAAGNDEVISLEYAKSFLVDERFPSDYTKPTKEFTRWQAYYLAAKIQLAAL